MFMNNTEYNDKLHKNQHNEDYLRLTNKRIGWIVSFVIALNFFCFIIGYFWGQKKAVEHFSGKVEQGSFADQIYSSMCTLCDNAGDIDNNEEEIDQTNGKEEGIEKGIVNTIEQQCINNADSSPLYHAQLIGFGNANNAQRFVARLREKGVSLVIHERTSKTARGKKIMWYQVTTESYTNKEELDLLVAKLKKEEKLHDIRIIAQKTDAGRKVIES